MDGLELGTGWTSAYREVSEPSLVVLRAVDELGRLLGQEFEDKLTKEDLVKELDHLERVMASKIAEIKEKIEKLS